MRGNLGEIQAPESKDPRAPLACAEGIRRGSVLRSLTSRSGPRPELSLGLGPRLPMPRGRQLGTARWCHASYTPSCRVDDDINLAFRPVLCKRKPASNLR